MATGAAFCRRRFFETPSSSTKRGSTPLRGRDGRYRPCPRRERANQRSNDERLAEDVHGTRRTRLADARDRARDASPSTAAGVPKPRRDYGSRTATGSGVVNSCIRRRSPSGHRRRRRERFSPRRRARDHANTRARSRMDAAPDRRRARRELPQNRRIAKHRRARAKRRKKIVASSSATVPHGASSRRSRRERDQPAPRSDGADSTAGFGFGFRSSGRVPPRGRAEAAADVSRATALGARGARRGARRTRSDATFFSPILPRPRRAPRERVNRARAPRPRRRGAAAVGARASTSDAHDANAARAARSAVKIVESSRIENRSASPPPCRRQPRGGGGAGEKNVESIAAVAVKPRHVFNAASSHVIVSHFVVCGTSRSATLDHRAHRKRQRVHVHESRRFRLLRARRDAHDRRRPRSARARRYKKMCGEAREVTPPRRAGRAPPSPVRSQSRTTT